MAGAYFDVTARLLVAKQASRSSIRGKAEVHEGPIANQWRKMCGVTSASSLACFAEMRSQDIVEAGHRLVLHRGRPERRALPFAGARAAGRKPRATRAASTRRSSCRRAEPSSDARSTSDHFSVSISPRRHPVIREEIRGDGNRDQPNHLGRGAQSLRQGRVVFAFFHAPVPLAVGMALDAPDRDCRASSCS